MSVTQLHDMPLSLDIYVPAVEAYQRVKVDPRAVDQPILAFGQRLGNFPRTGSESYSWFLKSEDNQLRGWRIQFGQDLTPALTINSAVLYGCSCGIISSHPTRAHPFCLLCGVEFVQLDHGCASLPWNLRFVTNSQQCPYCGYHDSPVSALLREDGQEEDSRPLSEQSHRLMPINGNDLVREQKARFPQEALEAAGARSSRGSQRRLLISSIVVGIVGLIFFAAFRASEVRRLEREVRLAVQEERILLPRSDSLVIHLSELMALAPSSEILAALREECILRISERAEEALELRYNGSISEPSWADLESAYSLLIRLAGVRITDDDQVKKFRARRRLCFCELSCRNKDGVRTENIDQAMVCFKDSHDLDPNWSLPLNSLGEIYLAKSAFLRRSGEFRELARDYFTSATRRQPRLLSAHLHLVEIAEMEGDVAASMRSMAEAALLFPQDQRLQERRILFLARHRHCEDLRRERDLVGLDVAFRRYIQSKIDWYCR